MAHSPSLFKSALFKASHLSTDEAKESDRLNVKPIVQRTLSTPPTLVSAAYQSPLSRLHKQRRLLFKARTTTFDISNPDQTDSTFRGFYTLFWLAMAVYVIVTAMRSYEQEGVIISLGFFRLLSQDSLALLISDMMMVGTTVFSVLFSKLLVWGVIPYEPVGVILQHVCQTIFLFLNIYWTFWRDWPWVQSGFFTLHTIVMMMKMHSYTSLNGDLSVKYWQLKHLKQYIPQWMKEHPDVTASTNQELERMESEVKFLEEELVDGQMHFPNNVTLSNYFDYLLVPTLVYALEYPRTERIRPWYVFEKTMATLGTFLLLYITTENYILPKLYDPQLSDLRVIIELLFPLMINYLFIFYIIFECILNAFAELSRFADRNFYDDWWNSVTYGEFARKWNKPVHKWLLRHVYAQSMESYQFTKANATFVTFLFSSCLHELVLVIVTRRIRMYLFVLQMIQLPLIILGQQPFLRNHPIVGNIIFWLGMLVGLPLLAILYCREAFWSSKIWGIGSTTP